MKLNYHIRFADSSNPYFHRAMDAKEAIKEVNNWVKSGNYNFNNHYTLFDFENCYRIESTNRGTWKIYEEREYYEFPLAEYRWLGNAVKFLEKLLDNASQKC